MLKMGLPVWVIVDATQSVHAAGLVRIGLQSQAISLRRRRN